MRPLARAPKPAHQPTMRRHLLLVAALIGVVGALLCQGADPQIIHNASPSAPVGFYWRVRHSPAIGDFVTVQAARVAPDYARLRNFADPSDRFIKRVAAVGGDSVCARGNAVTIRETTSLPRAMRDRQGRTLPLWSGCRMLRPDEVFLAGDTPDSFDSRYWGPVPTQVVDGVWTPIQPPAGFRDP